jgi:primary-amine oxidase
MLNEKAVHTGAASSSAAVGVAHPLDPASVAELERAVELTIGSGLVGTRPHVCWAALDEPGKAEMLAWTPARPAPARRVKVVVVDRASSLTHEAIVDVGSGVLDSCQALDGLHAPVLGSEFEDCQQVKTNPAVQAALARRGVTDLATVYVEPWPAAYFDRPYDERNRRLVRAVFYVYGGELQQPWSRPVQGLVAVTDRATGEVVELIDEGSVPVPAVASRIDPEGVGALRDDVKPLEIIQRDGPSFTLEGNELRWQRWRMRLSLHPMEGLVIHQIAYDDPATGRTRPIMYRASLAEMVVPYGDPQGQHFWRHVFDQGEVGMGRATNTLSLGCDCLGEIRYLDAPMVGWDGVATVVERAVCIHEEDNNVLWRHRDSFRNVTEARRDRRLVVSYWATLGNYDYGFFWYFHQDGNIELEIKLTGIVLTGATETDAPAGPYGVKLTPELEAPHHQHFFCLRLDLDIDGPVNRIEEVDVAAEPAGPDNLNGNAFRTRATVLARESEAKRRADAAASRSWRIVNPEVRNVLGQPVAYQLLTSSAPLLYAQPDSAAAKRAAFAQHHLHVTPYAPDEMRASGEYPTQHPGGAGLPAYMAADRELTDTDLVVWVTCGVTHVARPEEYPVMPVERTGFLLRPHGFFDRNPALDLPPLAVINGTDACSGNGADGHG